MALAVAVLVAGGAHAAKPSSPSKGDAGHKEGKAEKEGKADKDGKGKYKHSQAIADKTGRPVSEINSLRDSGMGWGEIAKKYGTTMGEIKGKGHGKKGKDKKGGGDD